MFDGTGRISLRWFHVYTADAVSFLGCFTVLVGTSRRISLPRLCCDLPSSP